MRTMLDHFTKLPGVSEIAVGDARGADNLVRLWCFDHKYPVQIYYADWEKHGKAAGPIRNTALLNGYGRRGSTERAGMLLAFRVGNESRGTDDCISQARAMSASGRAVPVVIVQVG